MTTALQSAVGFQLTARQQNILRALQNKVEYEYKHGYKTPTQVSAAQQRVLQAAYNAAKASGIEVPPEVAAAAKNLGLV
jgi:hypothetical protein